MENHLKLDFKERFKCPQCGEIITLDVNENACPKCGRLVTAFEKEKGVKFQDYLNNQSERDDSKAFIYIGTALIFMICAALFGILIFVEKMNLAKFANQLFNSDGLWIFVALIGMGLIFILIGIWKVVKNRDV